eukprot:5207063-Alexandrium_andersonii.AAC.1
MSQQPEASASTCRPRAPELYRPLRAAGAPLSRRRPRGPSQSSQVDSAPQTPPRRASGAPAG